MRWVMGWALLAGCTGGSGGPDDTDDTDAADTDAIAFERTVGDGVFLYTGSGGNNYDTDADAVRAVFAAEGVTATAGETLPAGFTDDYGILVLLNPTEALPGGVLDAAAAIVEGGGRLVCQTEHSGYGGHDQAARALEAAGSSMRSVEDSEAGELALQLASVPPLTDGVDEIVPFYAARVDVGDGVALGRVSDDFVVIGYETVGGGDVVVVADGSMFGYNLDQADNTRFVLNLATLRD